MDSVRPSTDIHLDLKYGTYTKAKVMKAKGASALTPISKRTKRAVNKRLATTMNQSIDELAPVAVHQDFA